MKINFRKKRGARGGFPGVWKDSSGDSDNPDPGEGGANGGTGGNNNGGATQGSRMSGKIILLFYASFKVILQLFFTSFLLLVFMQKYTKCIVSVY